MQRWSEALLKLMRHCDRHAKCHHSTSTSSSLQPLRKRTEHSLLTIDYQKIGGGGERMRRWWRRSHARSEIDFDEFAFARQ